ncbi:MAG: hypothetical protein LC725_00025 [Lentisphaerae bacterium]|nr:hypothetical protein [Lentisphaerota bacterium]
MAARPHAVPANAGPILSYEFENATVSYFSAAPNRLIARLRDGSSKDYGVPTGELRKSFWRLVESVHTGERPACGIAAASSHTLCVNGVQESVPAPVPFPEELVNRDDQGVTWVQGLMSTMIACYDQWRLPSELGGVPWASPGRIIDLRNYRRFPANN